MSDSTRHMNDTTMPPPLRRKGGGGSSSSSSSNTGVAGTATAAPRQKVLRSKGFGLSDWNKLVRASTDLAQLKGQGIRRNITWTEIKQHRELYDGWVVLRGKVYNISPYLPYHPGGQAILHKVLGKDITALYDKYHRWVNEQG